jgi:hypothetical protein
MNEIVIVGAHYDTVDEAPGADVEARRRRNAD